MHSWNPLSPWFSVLDKFSLTTGGVPTPATIFPSLREDYVNNHLSLGVPPPNMDMQTPCQVEVTPHKSEGIEPFTLINSPPGQVGAMSLHPINTPLGQVRVTPCNPEGIKLFTLVNSPPGQVGAMSLHLINTLLGQVQVTPCNSEGIKPFTMVNSPPCQVRVTPFNPEGIEPFVEVF